MDNNYYRVGPVQVISIAASSAAITNPWAAETTHVRLATPAVGVWYTVATTPVATISTSTYLPPNMFEIIAVAPGQKVACIQPTAPAGTFNVTELVR